MKCEIQWMRDGHLTPDDNEAVAMACYHEEPTAYSGYSEKISKSFPICQEHLDRVTPDYLFPVGGWSFFPLTGGEYSI